MTNSIFPPLESWGLTNPDYAGNKSGIVRRPIHSFSENHTKLNYWTTARLVKLQRRRRKDVKKEFRRLIDHRGTFTIKSNL